MLERIKKNIEEYLEKNYNGYEDGNNYYVLGYLHGITTMAMYAWFEGKITVDEYNEIQEYIYQYIDNK